MPDHCSPFQERLNGGHQGWEISSFSTIFNTINVLNQCTKYTHNKTITLTDNKLHYSHDMFFMLHVFSISLVSVINKMWCSQTGPCFERSSEALRACTHQRFQSTAFFKTTILSQPGSFICSDIPRYGVWTAFDNHYNNSRSPKGGMLSCNSISCFFSNLGTLPKYQLVSPKIFAGNHTADVEPLSCVLDYKVKYDNSNPMD